jgi:hypothetical protein
MRCCRLAFLLRGLPRNLSALTPAVAKAAKQVAGRMYPMIWPGTETRTCRLGT